MSSEDVAALQAKITFYSYFTTAMILLLVHPIVESTSPSIPTDDSILILHALKNISHWSHVPFMKQPLTEMMRIAQLKGLTT